jgi:hypothetical protein
MGSGWWSGGIGRMLGDVAGALLVERAGFACDGE